MKIDKLRFGVVMFFAFVFCLFNINAETYYVSTSGSDLNDGLSIENAWESVDKAWSDSVSDSVVFYLEGTYDITSTIVLDDGKDNITHINYNGGEVIWNSLVSRQDSVFEIYDSHITVDGMTVIGYIEGGDDGIFELFGDTVGFTLRNCIGIQNSFSGTQGGPVGNTGVVIGAESPNTLVENCILSGPGGEIGADNSAGIIMFRGQNWTIRNNEFYGFHTCLFYNKHTNDPAYPGSIENNYFHDCHTAMRFMGNEILILNNIFDGNVRSGYHGGCNDFLPQLDCGSDNNEYVNNMFTSIVDLQSATSDGDILPGARNNVFRNNIFLQMIDLLRYSNIVHGTDLDYNLYTNGDILYNNRIQYDLLEWQSYYGQDENSISGTPTFAGGVSFDNIEDYALASNSIGYGEGFGPDVSLVGPTVAYIEPVIETSICGNSVVESGEDCDDGNLVTESCLYGEISCQVCDSSCNEVAGSVSYCGDGICDASNEDSSCSDCAQGGEEEPVITNGNVTSYVIDVGDDWRYFKGVSEPVFGWTDVAFDDSSWDVALSGIGYGENYLTTILDDMQNNYRVLYLRKSFDLDDFESMESMILDIIYDDGFIVYVNGEMITSAYMNAELTMPIDGNHLEGEYENFDLSSGVLREGENVIAFEVHNVNLGSSDLVFIPVLNVTYNLIVEQGGEVEEELEVEPVVYHAADEDESGKIEFDEVIDYANSWVSGEIEMSDLIDAIKIWGSI